MRDSIYNHIMDGFADSSIVGYHKCGNTWVSTFLRSYFVEKYDLPDHCMAKMFVNDYRVRELLSFPRRVPAIHFTHALLNPDKPTLAGTQEFLDRFTKKPMVVLTRNIKDVLVSSFMHEKYREVPSVFEGQLSDHIRSASWGVQKIVGYYNLIASSRAASSAKTLVIHYGDLWRQTENTFKSLVSFLDNEPLDNNSFDYALERSSFKSMRKLEDDFTSENVVIPGLFRSQGGGESSRKTRKGGVGGYREEMTKEDIAFIDVYTKAHLSQYWDIECFLNS